MGRQGGGDWGRERVGGWGRDGGGERRGWTEMEGREFLSSFNQSSSIE